MADKDIRETTTTTHTIQDFSPGSMQLDSPEGAVKTVWDNRDFAVNLAYLKTIPEVNSNITALATWTAGKGWTADDRVTAILEGISGNGKQSFQTIMESHIVMKKINGDAYIEIIRHDKNGTIINFKLLNPARIRVHFAKNGLIEKYEQLDVNKKKVTKTFRPNQILHSINEPIGDEIHGMSVIEPAKWAIDAKNEAMRDVRRVQHRSTIRVLYVDEDDSSTLNKYKAQYVDAIKKGELLIIPGKPGENQFDDLTAPPIDNFMQWIRYLDNFIYTAVKIPKIITGGAEDHTEASSKVGYITFDPVYSQEQLELEADLWNQCAIRVKFNRPAELGGLMTQSEEKNTGQTGFQPNEVEATTTRTE